MKATKQLLLSGLVSLLALGAVSSTAMANSDSGQNNAERGYHGGKHGMRHGGHHRGHRGMKRGKRGGKNMGRMLDRMASKLDLNDAQKQKLEALKTVIKTQQEARMADRKARMEQRKADGEKGQGKQRGSMFLQGNVDQAAIIAKMKERSDKRIANAQQRIAAMAAFSNSLTDEQRAQVKTMMEKKGKGRGHRGQRRQQEQN